jgi:hypothetical protein
MQRRAGCWALFVCAGSWALFLCPTAAFSAEPTTPAKELPLHEPAVRGVFPLGGTAGMKIETEIEGDFLDRASSIRCDCADVSGTVRRARALRVTAEMNISPSAEPGLRVMYLESPRGSSNRFLFRITRWKSQRETEPNDQVEQAQVLTAPQIVEGRIARLTDVDFFRFHAQAGERLAFNILAARTKAPGFVSIALLDASGRELARKHSGVGPDPYLEHRFQDAGDYYIAIYPRRFADFFTVVKDDQLINWQYQLAIGRSPMLLSVFPPGGRRGTSVDVEVHAEFLDAGAKPSFSGKGVTGEPLESIGEGKFRTKVHVAADAEPGIHLLSFPDDSGNLGPLGFSVSDTPEILAADKQPQVVLPPVTINGRIRSPGEHNAFRFKVNSDDAMTLRVEAKSLGSQMTDPQLVLVRAEGDFADSADERCKSCAGFYSIVARKEMLDPQMTHAFISRAANDADAAGDYDAVILDNSSRGSDDLTYRLAIRPQHPIFHAGATSDHVNAEHGGPAWIPISVTREEGFKGDIEIIAGEVPENWTVKPLRIPGSEDSGKLEVRGQAAGTLHLLARATVDGKPVTEPVMVPPVAPEDGAGYLELPREALQVAFVDKPLFSLTVDEPAAGFVMDRQKRPEVSMTCKIQRCAGCAGTEAPLEFEMDDPPAGIRIASQQLSPDATSATLTLAADPNSAVAGQHRIALRARGKAAGGEVSETTSAISIRVR